MTASELRALGLARYGIDWQSPLARALGISPRHVRRMNAGTSAIPPRMEAEILRLFGATSPDQAWPRDRWIVGDAQSDTGARREYVIHTGRPRFIARIVPVDYKYCAEDLGQPADILSGITFAAASFVLAEILWLDAPPPEATLHTLLTEAAAAVDAA